MREVFLGKPWHWLMAAVAVALLGLIGYSKMHVIHFNNFVWAVLAIGLVMVVLVLKTTRPDEQITRDPLPDPDDQESSMEAMD
ncbi:MAG: hypothetical protein CMM61_08755 [Rhodospirillaceae bacterium]|nr:hypothetical protein [Rhodospirillaceae bacterium]|tara:strand:- start:504 stop:752 length:249 start_codon:yes stop_codon:yes gene_type:complete